MSLGRRRSWIGAMVAAVALAATLALPFAWRREERPALTAQDVLVVITPHNEAIRFEFARGFARWHRERTGRSVAVDWRVIGGTSEIARYLEGEYTQSFRLHWERALGRRWSGAVERAFDDPSVRPDDSPGDDTEAAAARRAFLASEAGCGIDLFFGGGSYDFARQAAAGRLVDSGIFERHPEWFPEVIPQEHGGETFWAADHTWIGAALSSFGIVYNRDALRRLGIATPPQRWRDLADPRYAGELALADPTKSGSIAKAFEMVIQTEMLARQRQLRAAGMAPAAAEARAVREGWREGVALLQLIAANARYFTDSAPKPPIDVAQGDAAAGMCIDFYGRVEAETVGRRSGANRADEPRVAYVTPPGGSVYSADPIAMLRGAPHRELALEFIEYVLSPEGQRLWNLRPGTPGGPVRYALRRLPVRRDLYTAEWRPLMSDPEAAPYSESNDFVYHAEWTGGLLREIALVVQVACLQTHDELAAAWRAIIDAGRPAAALATLQDLGAVDYDAITQRIGPILHGGRPLDEMRLRKELAEHFRRQYARAAELARAAQTTREPDRRWAD